MRLRGGLAPAPVVAAPARGAMVPSKKNSLLAAGMGGIDVELLMYFAGWYLGNYYYNSASSLPAD